MASELAVAAGIVRSVWLEQPRYEAAERHHYEVLADRHAGLKIEVRMSRDLPLGAAGI